jgi:hypothetical protein
MNKKLKYFIIIVLVGLIVGLAGVYYVYNKPQRNISKEKPAYIIDPASLVNDFNMNEDSSTMKYNGKVIQVSGQVVEYDPEKTGTSIVFVNSIGGVTCSFDSITTVNNFERLSNIKVGDSLTLKGKCDGFDNINGVVLSKCVLVK